MTGVFMDSMARIPCCIPACTRTMGTETAVKRFGQQPGEWICATHWARIPRAEKRVWSRFKRQSRRFGGTVRPEAYDRVWEALKRRAA